MKSPTPHLTERTGAIILKTAAWPGENVYLFEREVWRGVPDVPGSVGGSIIGVEAEVLTQGQLTQRLTVTRMVTLGIFALAAPKKSGNQELLLSVTAPVFGFTYAMPGIESLRLKMINQFADAINNQSKKVTPTAGPELVGDAIDQISRLAELRDRGLITDGEYQAKRSELLDRI